MRNKESAIAVMIAVMLGAASLLGGFSAIPALAFHDSDAVQVASETISQGDTESIIVDAVEMSATKSTTRASGTVTVAIVQDGMVLDSGDIVTNAIGTFPTDVEAHIGGLNVTGDFEILVEYVGSGYIMVDDIGVQEGTEVAEQEQGEPDGGGETTPASADELENVIASETLAPDGEDGMSIDTVELTAKKSTTRASGTVTVAIVQDGMVLGKENIGTSAIGTFNTDLVATFNGLEVEDENFQVVIMYDGSGNVEIADINVPSGTSPAEEPGTPSGTVMLTVNAEDEAGSAIAGMWIEVYIGGTVDSTPDFTGETPTTFELDAGDYVVAVADFEDNIFQRWEDSTQDRTREATLAGDETFTAVYSTDGTQPAGNPDDADGDGIADAQDTCPSQAETFNGFQDADGCPDTPPAGSGPGSITVFAHRIPSEFWGSSTFVSANAQMWFVLYNSTGWMVHSGFYDENGSTVTGLNDGETYYVYATDCDECHGDTHDVVFDHWEDSSTVNPRATATGASEHAYYAYDPDP